MTVYFPAGHGERRAVQIHAVRSESCICIEEVISVPSNVSALAEGSVTVPPSRHESASSELNVTVGARMGSTLTLTVSESVKLPSILSATVNVTVYSPASDIVRAEPSRLIFLVSESCI